MADEQNAPVGANGDGLRRPYELGLGISPEEQDERREAQQSVRARSDSERESEREDRLRQRALELAAEGSEYVSFEETLARAKAYLAFLKGGD